MLKRQPNHFDILTPWRSQLAATIQAKPWLAGVLLRCSRRLLRRFAHFYRRLQALPCCRRRLLQRKLGATLAGMALLLALSGGSAQANDIIVAAGVVDINGNDGQCSLIEAIENANDTNSGQPHSDCAPGDPVGADTIHLAAGSAFTLQVINNSIYNTGLPVIRSNITIEGNGAAINRNSAAPTFGMLAVNKDGQLTLNETTISGGLKWGRGGAVFQYKGSGPLTIKNSTISGNRATTSGGGVYINEGLLIIDNSTISGNQATSSGGGVFHLQSTITINNSTIAGNRAASGGGVVSLVGQTTISHSTIAGNQATGNGGGMINNFSRVIINNSTISDNQATAGGGVYHAGNSLELNNSTLSHNRATLGGGIYVHNNDAAAINNSTISDNEATRTGGGLYQASGRTALNRSLISGNVAPLGAEISNTAGVINADNSNLFGHAGLNNAQAFNNFTPDLNDLNAAVGGGIPTPLAAILNTTLADNGGETQTHALVFDSPALDAAPSRDCTAAPINGVDQRDQPRNIADDISKNNGTACDIGAFELQAGHLTIVKTLFKDMERRKDFPFMGPLGPFILTTNTTANNQTFDLPPGVYTFRENAPRLFGLLSVTCIDDRGNDVTAQVVDNFSAVEMKADITLTGENVLRCTFLNERATFEAGEDYHRFYLPILVK